MKSLTHAELHAKDKGTLGQLAVAKELMRRGLPVFMEVGDNSKTDLIVIRKDQCIRIQVKSYKKTAGAVVLYGKKSGPGYKFIYRETDFDIFAVYLYETDEILYVPLAEVLKTKSKQINIRVVPPKNNQRAGIHTAADYKSFNKAVKYINGKPIEYTVGKTVEKSRSRRFVTDDVIKQYKKLLKSGYTIKEAANDLGFHWKNLQLRAKVA